MSDRVREAVSVLMDGEADELAIRRLLSQEDADSVRQGWSAYHRQRRVLQGADLRFEQWDISTSVMAALADEPAYSEKLVHDEKQQREWLKPLTGFAVAASVAAVVVVSAPSWRTVDPSSAAVAASTPEIPLKSPQSRPSTVVAQSAPQAPDSVYLSNGEKPIAPVLQFPQQFNGGIPVSLQTGSPGSFENSRSFMYDNGDQSADFVRYPEMRVNGAQMQLPENSMLYIPASGYSSGFNLPPQK